MGEAHQELPLHIMVQEAKEANSTENTNVANQSTLPRPGNYKWWLLMIALYTFFVLCGQSAAILLGRLYYEKGGTSKWMATLMQLAGFPILLPYYFISTLKKHSTTINTRQPSTFILALVYVSFGLLTAGQCILYSIGMQYLPVSTFTLISASQLAFNAFFSFFLNSQKFTPFIVNSLVLLTISSTLLVFQSDSTKLNGVSKGQYVVGFLCTVGGSAGTGLLLSLQQLSFRKVIKKETFTAVMDMIIYQSLVGTSFTLVGLFASGDWKGLRREMDDFGLGKVSYVMTLIWAAIACQVFFVGTVGLIFEVSALFCNSICVLGLPVVPVLAVIFFHDKMDGLKVISMVLAIWGFVSYVYQHYLDDSKSKIENSNDDRRS